MSVVRFPSSALSSAARWFARQRGDRDGKTGLGFASWIQDSHANADAYQKVSKVWELSGGLMDDPEIMQQAKEATGFARGRSNRRKTAAAAAVAGFAIAAAVIVVVWPQHQAPHYATAGGETKTIVLADNSTVTLSAKTTLVVDYSKQQRRVHLLTGEAIFTVKHNDPRPFNVDTSIGLVTAVGTQFDVRQRNDALMSVDVLEGRVQVRDQASKQPVGLQLDAGENVAISKDAGFSPKQASEPSRIHAWENGKLLFAAVDLEDAVYEMNLFSNQQLVLVDKSLGKRKVSGVFRFGEADLFVRAVDDLLGATGGEKGQILSIVSRGAQRSTLN